MQRLHISSAIAAALLLAPGAALAQASAQASIPIDAKVVSSELTIEKESDINLGTIVRPSSGTFTVTLAPGGARSGSGGSGGDILGGAGSTAIFSVSGEANRDFTISTPSTVTLLLGAGGANREIVFTPAHAASANTGAGAGGVGITEIEVHGSVAVPSTIDVGAYTASMAVTVEYQ